MVKRFTQMECLETSVHVVIIFTMVILEYALLAPSLATACFSNERELIRHHDAKILWDRVSRDHYKCRLHCARLLTQREAYLWVLRYSTSNNHVGLWHEVQL